jgi:hypothetical protein
MNVTMIVLRIIHIGAGVFWAGAVFVNEGFLLPTMKATGPGGAPFMRHLMVAKKYPVRIAMSGVLVILSGLGMYWRDGAMSNGTWYRSRQAMVYGIGGLSAIIALAYGLAVLTRAAAKMNQVGAAVQASGGPPSPEQAATIAAMQQRITSGTHFVAGLIGIAVIAMAIGRYV